MIKGLKYYTGNVILGYKFTLPKLESSFSASNIKKEESVKKGNNNNLKCLKKVKRTFNK